MRGLLLLRDRETLNFTNVSLQLWHTTLGKGTVLALATPHLGVVVHGPLVRAQAQPAASHRKKVGILVTFSFPEFLVWIVPCNDQRLSVSSVTTRTAHLMSVSRMPLYTSWWSAISTL